MSKVRVKFVVEMAIDPELWDADYGTGYEPSDIVGDVQQHVETALQALIDQTDENANVRVRRA